MKKNNKVKENNLQGKNYIMIGVGAVLVIVIIGFLLVKGCSNDKNNDKNNENNGNEDVITKKGATEEDIIAAYGMSKQDAINLVKALYNSDNFEFTADINEDSKYIVSVKNIITNNVDKYFVDPTSSGESFYIITE